MTPMLFPLTPSHASGGAASEAGELVPGAPQGVPGADSAVEFAGFDVTLQSVLEEAASAEEDGEGAAEEEPALDDILTTMITGVPVEPVLPAVPALPVPSPATGNGDSQSETPFAMAREAAPSLGAASAIGMATDQSLTEALSAAGADETQPDTEPTAEADSGAHPGQDVTPSSGQSTGSQLDGESQDGSRRQRQDGRGASLHHLDEVTGLLRRSTSERTPWSVPVVVAPLLGPLEAASRSALTAMQAASVPVEVPSAAQNLSRLVQSMRVQAREGGSEATIRLNPEHLGEVTIAVRVERGVVTAVVHAASADVRQWLKGQEEAIRTTLAEQGLNLERLVVEQDGHQGEAEDDAAQREPRQRRSRPPRANAPRFEVTA